MRATLTLELYREGEMTAETQRKFIIGCCSRTNRSRTSGRPRNGISTTSQQTMTGQNIAMSRASIRTSSRSPMGRSAELITKRGRFWLAFHDDDGLVHAHRHLVTHTICDKRPAFTGLMHGRRTATCPECRERIGLKPLADPEPLVAVAKKALRDRHLLEKP